MKVDNNIVKKTTVNFTKEDYDNGLTTAYKARFDTPQARIQALQLIWIAFWIFIKGYGNVKFINFNGNYSYSFKNKDNE